jgi:hypothetical protein
MTDPSKTENLPELERPVQQLGEREAENLDGGTYLYVPYLGTCYHDVWYVPVAEMCVKYYAVKVDE